MRYEKHDEQLVSIITPVLNCKEYIHLCIQSIINQSYPNVEHILIDGLSTDGSVEIIQQYQAKYPNRIRFISRKDNCPEDAINYGINLAKGKIIGMLGADDRYKPNTISIVVNYFSSHPNVSYVYGGCDIIDEKGNIIFNIGQKDFNYNTILNVSSDNNIPWSSSFFKIQVVQKIGYYRESNASDFDFILRAGKEFKIDRIHYVLSEFRQHQNQMSRKSRWNAIMLRRDMYQVSLLHGGNILSGYAISFLKYVPWQIPILFELKPFFIKIYSIFRNLKRKIPINNSFKII
jgi:glycosyltransferase involved in cell wall biosynthesis